jgi:NAD(P)-dependent dehydrogenase (short-subunit alcohol dehydrogenase family)
MSEATRTSRVALVTGASGGIGSALVRQLLANGWRVAAVGREATRLESTLAGSTGDTSRLRLLAADTTEPEGAARAIAACAEAFGAPPQALAHCVGSTLIAPLHRTAAAAWRETLRVNLDSAAFTLGAWIDSLRQAQLGGAAVLASSVVARIGVANHEAIAAAKAGVEALARSAAATYAPLGLRFNVVAPGMTETLMTAGMLKVPAMREAAGRQYPLGGVQSADAVAATMAWLLSDAAARITGQVLPVDGGFTSVRPLVK